ncbi:MAG: glycine cleavage system aminomethyltransferase GcvT [Eubacteriaceae bacterium]|nr:glycine cleavage system aminomethyltransferase GcvT [Eubacteriaceae bacterium]
MKQTVLNSVHIALGAKMVDYAGWEMPANYDGGQMKEHLACRKNAVVFDISHMGRLKIDGPEAKDFLQKALTANIEVLEPFNSQYTIISNENGSAIDDAYLYRFGDPGYLLVVNAANHEKDVAYLSGIAKGFDVAIDDITGSMAMVSLQGPQAKAITQTLAPSQFLTDPFKNACGELEMFSSKILIAKTGYTGEPLGFEFFVPAGIAADVFNEMVKLGATPAGLGARDTLRLEAALPLYGHEFGIGPDGEEMPIFAFTLSKGAVSFSADKGDYVGREALAKQLEALKHIRNREFDSTGALPRIIRPFTLTGKGIPREGNKIFKEGKHVGYVTSGTMAPFYLVDGYGLDSGYTDQTATRPIGLAILDNDIDYDLEIAVEIRGKLVEATTVKYHMRSEAPPFSMPIIAGYVVKKEFSNEGEYSQKAEDLVFNAVKNHEWRQQLTVNLIPSEMTASPATRLLSVSDPAFRYAEHKKVKAYYDWDVFYYQGTDFIENVEALLVDELKKYLGASQVESRILSGQMANTVLYSALLDYKNRVDRKSEPTRLGYVMNNHIINGGHLSAQPMGALRDFIAIDPLTEKKALVNFPPLKEDPYTIDIELTKEYLERYKPELVIFGKSMVLYREPVEELAAYIKQANPNAIIMYDMAHVLGLVGEHFQEPFKEGADFVTGSTHKTFFGTQRGVIASSILETDHNYNLWHKVESRAFPGGTSNHHLGTMLGLLMATFEMNAFKDTYQPAVIANAKAFAKSMKSYGLDVAGDESRGFTETHQVVAKVGYANGPAVAKTLEQNNIITNFQATPEEEGFSASGAIRLGVSEMTRFGFGPKEFDTLAALIAEVVLKGKNVSGEVSKLRSNFLEMQYVFDSDRFNSAFEELVKTI